ncbi:SDR family oxidoreductase [Pseudomonadales bacterium]|nr:SDR family oxidoreductase [Pseudomonadales bacterium]
MSIFSLDGKTAVITGGGGLLGIKHAEALAEFGANIALLDNNVEAASTAAQKITEEYSANVDAFYCDVTSIESISSVCKQVKERFGGIEILINNAANNPQVKNSGLDVDANSRFETFTSSQWFQDLNVNLTGAFYCCQMFGSEMVENKGGIILNIASDLSVIAPDQRLYRKAGETSLTQATKPVSYSVSKFGLLGLTKYLATYWADQNIRVNALSPAGVYVNQDEDFVDKITSLIPMSRMASPDEYKGAVIFLCSDASKYMTGANLIIDGGRSIW